MLGILLSGLSEKVFLEEYSSQNYFTQPLTKVLLFSSESVILQHINEI